MSLYKYESLPHAGVGYSDGTGVGTGIVGGDVGAGFGSEVGAGFGGGVDEVTVVLREVREVGRATLVGQ